MVGVSPEIEAGVIAGRILPDFFRRYSDEELEGFLAELNRRVLPFAVSELFAQSPLTDELLQEVSDLLPGALSAHFKIYFELSSDGRQNMKDAYLMQE